MSSRRIKAVKKVKELHSEVADDIWAAVSAGHTNLDLGNRVDDFKVLIETKKKALAAIET